MSIIRNARSCRGMRSSVAAAIGAALLALAMVAPALATDRVAHLVDAHVSPRLGLPTTTITFSVTYRDVHGGAPGSVIVLIDGSARPMTGDGGTDFAAGVRYSVATTLPTGVHVVVFKAWSANTGPAFAPAGLVTIGASGGGDGTGGGSTGGGSANGGTGGDGGAGSGAGTGTGAGTGGGTGSGTGGDAPSPSADTGGGTTPGAGGSGGDTATPHPTKAPATHGDGAGGTTSGGTHGAGSTPGATAAKPKTTSPANGTDGATNDLPTAAPNAPVTPAATDGTRDVAVALGAGSGTDGAGSGGGTTGDGDHLTDRTLAVLGVGGITPTQRMVIVAISTTTTIMAFLIFGKRRRDGEPPAPDEVLAANAARLVSTASSTLVPVPATNPGLPPLGDEESDLPRWRRPSLLAARKADPLRSTVSTATLSFDHGVAAPVAGRERRRIRYRIVPLLDAPDELRSQEIGFLDQGDEVQLLELSGSYWMVLCPDGSRGWLHRMTLGEVVDDGSAGSAPVPATPGDAIAHGSDGAAEADWTDGDEDGDDLLGAYLRLRHHS